MEEIIIVLILILIIFVAYDTNTYGIDGFIGQALAIDTKTADHPITPVCNDVDGRCYKVAAEFDKSSYKQASEYLAQLNEFSIKLLKHMRNTYLWDNPRKTSHDKYFYAMTKFLLNNYNQDNIIENAPVGDVNTSYVEDKGHVFAVCLREKKSGQNQFHRLDEISYVMLHEMAHLATDEKGHGTKFWVNFKILTIEAEKIGIYTPIDYEKYPFNYCSLEVVYNPYYDDDLIIP